MSATGRMTKEELAQRAIDFQLTSEEVAVMELVIDGKPIPADGDSITNLCSACAKQDEG